MGVASLRGIGYTTALNCDLRLFVKLFYIHYPRRKRILRMESVLFFYYIGILSILHRGKSHCVFEDIFFLFLGLLEQARKRLFFYYIGILSILHRGKSHCVFEDIFF